MLARTVARIPRILAYDCNISGNLLMITILRIAVSNPWTVHMPTTTRAVRNEGVEADALIGEMEVALGKKSRKSNNLEKHERLGYS